MDDVMYLIAGAVKQASRLQEELGLANALVKSARDNNLTLEQTKRMVESLNTLNTLDQFKHSKTAEFDIADSRDILDVLFHEKSAELLGTPQRPMEYQLADQQEFIPFQDRLMLKAAHQVLDTASSPARYDRDPRQLAMILGQRIDAMEKEAQEWGVKAEHAKDELMRGVERLAWSFQKQGAPTLTKFASEALQKWRGNGREYLSLLGQVVPEKFHGHPVEKRASAWLDDRTEQHRLFKWMLESDHNYAQCLSKAAEARETANRWKEGLRAAFFPKTSSLSKLCLKARVSLILQ